MTLPFFIPDTSPLLTYSPCVDCQPGSGPSWKAGYGPRGDGYDQTYHEVIKGGSIQSAPTVELNLTAASVSILTSGSEDGCGVEYSVDDGDYTSGCTITDYPVGRHSLTIAPMNGTTEVRILGISGESSVTATGSVQNKTLDTTEPSFSFTGGWSHLTSIGSTGSGGNSTLDNQFLNTGMGGFYNSTVAVSTTEGDEMTLKFEGIGIYLYGMAGPEGGAAAVILDGEITNTLNTTGAWRAYSSLFFFATDLAPGHHELKLSNLLQGRQLVLDYAQVTTPAKAGSSLNLPKVLGITGGVSAILLVLAIALYIHITKRRALKKVKPIYAFSKGISYGDLSPAQASSIDLWRKKTAGSSTASTPSTAAQPDPYDGLAVHRQPGRPAGTPVRSPPPEYPDYLPYCGPVETRPPVRPESLEVPGIVGLNASTNGWLSQTMNDMHSTSPHRNIGRVVHRPSPIPVRDRQEIGLDEISLDDMLSQQELISPASTPSSLAFTARPIQAMGATRSVARLWPTSYIASSSSPDEPAPHASVARGISPHDPPSHGGNIKSGEAIVYPPSSGLASNTLLTPQSALGGSNQAVRSASYSDIGFQSPSSHSPMSPLRRGVSIKSVKTMRSFFSGLVGTGSAFPAIVTPAMPTQYSETFLIGTPARPDSDIFPASVSRSNSLVRSQSTQVRVTSSRSLARVTTGSYNSSIPPMLRLDTAGENFFIELDPDSPVTRVG